MPPTNSNPASAPAANITPPPDLWLCLRFTELALNALGMRSSCSTQIEQQAIAVIEQHRIFQANALAIAQGITPLMNSSHARMITPDIVLLTRKTHREEKHLEQLAHWAYRYTPVVCIHKHSLLMDIGGSITLFHGFKNLLSSIKQSMKDFGIAIEPAVAHTAKAAYVLSLEANNGIDQALLHRFNKSSYLDILSTASIEHLEIHHKTLQALRHCGFEQLQDILVFPAAEIGQRFGQEFLHYLQQLTGERSDIPKPIKPPETFRVNRDFAEPIHNSQWIDHIIDELLKELCDFLRQRQLHCQGFQWQFIDPHHKMLATLDITLASRQNSFDNFRQLTTLKLEKINLDQAFSGITLLSEQLHAMHLLPDDFFNPSSHDDDATQLIDKLRARIGQQQVYFPRLRPEHLPEYSLGKSLHRKTTQQTGAHKPALKSKPLWLLPIPRQLQQQESQPCHEGVLRLINGPERINTHWWHQQHYRDYFIARQTNGRLLWIFYDHIHKQWYLHGFFS